VAGRRGVEVLAKKLYVKDITEKRAVDCWYVISGAEIRSKTTGGKYLTCTVSDCTGTISCKIWGRSDDSEVETISENLQNGSVYRISGSAKMYNGTLEINVNEGIGFLNLAVPESELDPSEFTYAPVDTEVVQREIWNLLTTIQDKPLRSLTKRALGKAEGFFEKPAAVKNHHAYRGGLAEHTLEVARIALYSAETMPRFQADHDLILAGALLHDIGKCDGFEKEGFSFSALPAYRLHGHIVQAIALLSAIRTANGPDDTTFSHLLHIVASHHGEYGDVKPMTAEAWAVHMADNTSAKLRGVSDDLERCQPASFEWGNQSHGQVYRFDGQKSEKQHDSKDREDSGQVRLF